jgi:hypothetical protein
MASACLIQLLQFQNQQIVEAQLLPLLDRHLDDAEQLWLPLLTRSGEAEELYQRFKTDLGEVFSERELEEVLTFTHHVIHQVLLKSGSDLILSSQQQ